MRWYLDILAPTIMIGLGFGRIGCFLNGCCWGAPTKMPLAIRFPYGSLPFEDQWRTNHFVEVPAELILTTSDGTPFLLDHDTLKLTDDDLKKMMATVDPKTSAGYRLALIDGHLKAFNITLADMKKMIKDLNLKTVPIQPSQIYASLTAFIIAWVLSVYYWRRKRDGMVIAWLFVLYPATRIFEEMIRADNPHDTFGLTISQAISVAAIPAAFLFMLLLRKLPERSSRAIRELSAKQAQIENIKTAKPINVS
jgi:phosphatidylglycerol:prolipoprotein diacylglycerol transferase